MWHSRSIGPITLAVGIVSILVALAGYVFQQAYPRSAAATVAIGVGCVVGAVALASAVIFMRRDMDRRHLLAGKGLIAQWHVSPADWALFLVVDEAWAPGGGKRVRPVQAGPEGVAIFAGRDAILIGEAYYRFYVPHDVAWLPTQPECIELCLTNGDYVELQTLRVPVPAASRDEGRRAFDAWDGAIDPKVRERFRKDCRYDPQRGAA